MSATRCRCRYKSSGRAQLNAITTYIFSNSQFVPPFRLLPGSSYTTWNNSIRHPRPRPYPSPAVLDPVAASTSLPRRQDLCVKGLLNCQRARPSTIECNGPTTEPLQGVCVLARRNTTMTNRARYPDRFFIGCTFRVWTNRTIWYFSIETVSES